jgi:hypothetical protein
MGAGCDTLRSLGFAFEFQAVRLFVVPIRRLRDSGSKISVLDFYIRLRLRRVRVWHPAAKTVGRRRLADRRARTILEGSSTYPESSDAVPRATLSRLPETINGCGSRLVPLTF